MPQVRTVNEGKACDKAGLLPGMRLTAFQGESVDGKTWTQVRDLVKDSPKPWEFVFAADAAEEPEADLARTSSAAGGEAAEAAAGEAPEPEPEMEPESADGEDDTASSVADADVFAARPPPLVPVGTLLYGDKGC